MSIGHCEGYILKIWSLVVRQLYDVNRSSSGVQKTFRNCLGPLTEIKVMGYAYYWLFVSNYLDFLLDGQSLFSKNHS